LISFLEEINVKIFTTNIKAFLNLKNDKINILSIQIDNSYINNWFKDSYIVYDFLKKLNKIKIVFW